MVPGATTAIVCVRNLVPVTDTELVKVLLSVAVSALGAVISPSIATARTAIGQRTNLRRAVFSVNLERSPLEVNQRVVLPRRPRSSIRGLRSSR